jgi:hypothetical protein
MTINRIYKIQEEYFEFCLGLFQKVPQGSVDAEILITLYQLKDQLNEEIKQFQENCKCEAIREAESEIEKLRQVLKNKK